ncbi:hypothetical protein BO94DRAFT_148340 [Aspergillus sclerotioniger CBS 115572]|uniref:Uncharacterized protein n=1 Tax=Aspergillus sclerotioniger CBS 115572 TaxID=1450535 RepID=A0A317W587_9EURO|nr:hypothetical protein BO94DRAFT_148340 [Aspergillus sclerotioniger CBS 115572]PWY81724.1 hypothetical protein BO94DRAFT_148340 [Aspergillus sclerotioniger CBS 115572]
MLELCLFSHFLQTHFSPSMPFIAQAFSFLPSFFLSFFFYLLDPVGPNMSVA